MCKNIFSVLCLILLLACNKESGYKKLETKNGCLKKSSEEIINIPFATSVEDLIAGCSVKNGFKLKVYQNDFTTIATSIEDGYVLAIEKNGETKRTYKLSKLPLLSITVINGMYSSTHLTSTCGDINSSRANRETTYFNAIKDSSYDIYAYVPETAWGKGSFNCLDSLGNKYLVCVPAHPGAGVPADMFTPSYITKHTVVSKVTGRVFIEVYGTYSGNDEIKYLDSSIDIWVKQ